MIAKVRTNLYFEVIFFVSGVVGWLVSCLTLDSDDFIGDASLNWISESLLCQKS